MNRFAACDHILRMKDLGMKEIFIIIDGIKFQVPTTHGGEPSCTLSTKVGADTDNLSVLVPELAITNNFVPHPSSC